MTRFTCDASKESKELSHFWKYCIGSGHATLALRADWRAQLKQCHDELGIQHVRFHGLLSDDMNTVIALGDELDYSFHNIDQVYDYLRSINMRPIVELSFMPTALASGEKTVFHYRANVTPPADYNKWGALVSKLVSHWIDRYGADEVSRWPIEVWNEPNMEGFWSGTQDEYFKLFETTHKALKHVHPDLKVGGPVTAKNAWIEPFLDFCKDADVPPDFVSTHTYPTDAMGSPDDDTITQLSKSHLGILREQAEKVREQVGDKPLYYTEWSSSSNPRDKLHDDPYAAAFIVHTMLNMDGLVDAYSWWTFSDVFEENYMPSKPFQGGFGLMTIEGIPKPAYRAFQLLHELGTEQLEVAGEHDTLFVWAVRGKKSLQVVIVNLALPEHDIKTETVDIELSNMKKVASAQVRRIDAAHANAKAEWQMQGEPRYPSIEEVDQMTDASQLRSETLEFKQSGKTVTLQIEAEPQSVAVIELQFGARKRGSSGTSHAGPPHLFSKVDDDLLDYLSSAAFSYFTEHVNPDNGLIADCSRVESAASIAAVGFALSSYPVAVERGWLPRENAIAITLKTLQFFHDCRQDEDSEATGHQGFFYHFLDMQTGKRANKCELSTIDTGLLLAGMQVSAAYFDGRNPQEQRIRDLAKKLFDGVNWTWTLTDNNEMQQSWKPETGFAKDDWNGYTEALLMYVMGAACSSHPLPFEIYHRDVKSFDWSRNAGLEWVHASPLFIHLFPQAWMDLRGLDDGFVGKKGLDYFENTRRAVAIQRDYAHFNPNSFVGYGRDTWGLSACQGPDGKHERRDGEELQSDGYAARGVPLGPDDGTLVPWAAAACLAHDPKAALSGLHNVISTYPKVLRNGQFLGAFNPTLSGDGVEGWLAPACFGIDQGLVLMMIENARTGLIWKLTRKSPVFRAGLQALGFKGGWLG